MYDTTKKTLTSDEVVSLQSFGTNVAVLLQRGIDLPTVLLTLGEFLDASEEPTIAEANEYLINWARALNIGNHR